MNIIMEKGVCHSIQDGDHFDLSGTYLFPKKCSLKSMSAYSYACITIWKIEIIHKQMATILNIWGTSIFFQ